MRSSDRLRLTVGLLLAVLLAACSAPDESSEPVRGGTIVVGDDGLIEFHEAWEWESQPGSGTNIISTFDLFIFRTVIVSEASQT